MGVAKYIASAVLASAISAGSANAQSVTVDGVRSENRGTSFVRPNIFYKLGDVDGFAFLELYSDETYLGRNILTKELGRGFSFKNDSIFGSSAQNRSGAGVGYNVPVPKGASLDIKFLPFWVNSTGVDERIVMGYFVTVNLPAGFEALSFGEFNVLKGEWGYGEVSIGRSLDKAKKFGIYYNPMLKDKAPGNLTPRIEHAARASYKF